MLKEISNTKFCIACGENKSLDEFHINKSNTSDGRASYCKLCVSLRQKDKVKAMPKERRPKPTEAPKTQHCTICGIEKQLEAFPINVNKRTGRHSWCKLCLTKRNKVLYKAKKATSKEINRKDKINVEYEKVKQLVKGIKDYLSDKPIGTAFMVTIDWCEQVYGMEKIESDQLRELRMKFSKALDANPLLLGYSIIRKTIGAYCRELYIKKE